MGEEENVSGGGWTWNSRREMWVGIWRRGGETCQLISVIRLSCWMGFLHLFSSQICCLVHVSCESVLPFRVFS